MDAKKLKKELAKRGIDFVWEGDKNYNESRKICNSRFNYKPTVVAYCENETNISDCIKLSKQYKIEFRIRSGGHQHEGMCSGNGIMETFEKCHKF